MAKRKNQPKRPTQPARPVRQAVAQQSIRGLGRSLNQVQRLIQRFEREAGSLMGKITKRSEKSGRELSAVFEDIMGRLGSKDLAALASDTREGLQKQVRRLADDIVRAVQDVESLSERVDLSRIAYDMKQGLAGLVDQLIQSGLAQKAKRSVSHTKQGVFNLLNIPTQKEVFQLERKIVSLEKKLGTISRRAA